MRFRKLMLTVSLRNIPTRIAGRGSRSSVVRVSKGSVVRGSRGSVVRGSRSSGVGCSRASVVRGQWAVLSGDRGEVFDIAKSNSI